jgi:pimeloyl-ACP methyl ester carboxylesterase
MLRAASPESTVVVRNDSPIILGGHMSQDRTGPNDPLSPGWHAFYVDGLRQSYEVAGTGRVCVVHSGGPGINSDYLRMPLLEDDLTMVYLDPIGTGRSSLLPSGEYFVPTYAHYLESVLDHIGEPRPVILGHSHGGMVALELAIRSPNRLGGLIAYDTAPVFNDDLWEDAARQMAAFIERWPDRPEAARAARAWNGRRAIRKDLASARQWLADVTPAYFADYRRVVEGSIRLDHTWDPNRRNGVWSAEGRLGTIDAPTLIISGVFDFVCPPRWSKEMHAGIPGSVLLELPDSGHFGYHEQPEEFVAGVLEFLAGLT